MLYLSTDVVREAGSAFHHWFALIGAIELLLAHQLLRVTIEITAGSDRAFDAMAPSGIENLPGPCGIQILTSRRTGPLLSFGSMASVLIAAPVKVSEDEYLTNLVPELTAAPIEDGQFPEPTMAINVRAAYDRIIEGLRTPGYSGATHLSGMARCRATLWKPVSEHPSVSRTRSGGPGSPPRATLRGTRAARPLGLRRLPADAVTARMGGVHTRSPITVGMGRMRARINVELMARSGSV
jgi:hypothetical protein